MRYLIITGFLLMCGCGTTAKLTRAQPTPQASPVFVSPIQNVLIIGDSISGGYTNPVRDKLKPYGYNVRRIGTQSASPEWTENARNTNYTLSNVNKWITDLPNNKVILWNNGVWNTCVPITGADPSNYITTLSQYESQLISIAKILKAQSPRVIFFTTTQLPHIIPPDTPLFKEGMEVELNEIALRVLPPLGIEVYDLYSFTYGHDDWHPNAYDVHHTDSANDKISDWIIQNVFANRDSK